MANGFEELIVWRLAKEIAVVVYRTARKPPLCHDWSLRDQMQRAAVSISSNIAEGFERDSEKDDIRMLNIAKSSAGELRSQVLVAAELELVDQTDAELLVHKCRTVSSLLHRLIQAKRASMGAK